jgi:N-acyl homoserine lactone hydrolase
VGQLFRIVEQEEPAIDAERVYVFVGGSEDTLASLFDPWDPGCGATVRIPYFFYLVLHPRGPVLIDCGAHPDLAIDPASRLGSQAEMSSVVMGPGEDVLSRLASVGVKADAVEHVVLTHLHFDHCGGLAGLPGATAHVQAAERAFAENPPVYQQPAYIQDDWRGHRRWHELDGELDLFGDGSIRAIPTPGHTPGHQSVVVRLAGRTLVLVGDAAYHPTKMRERRLPGYLWNPDRLVESWEVLEAVEQDLDAELLFSHYPSPDQMPIGPESWLS